MARVFVRAGWEVFFPVTHGTVDFVAVRGGRPELVQVKTFMYEENTRLPRVRAQASGGRLYRGDDFTLLVGWDDTTGLAHALPWGDERAGTSSVSISRMTPLQEWLDGQAAED